jgi:hypothetical protein
VLMMLYLVQIRQDNAFQRPFDTLTSINNARKC